MDIAAYLFSVVQTLVVILQCGKTLLLAGFTVAGIHNIATENLLPEGKAAGRTWRIAKLASKSSPKESRAQQPPPGGIVCFRTGLRKGGKRTTYRH